MNQRVVIEEVRDLDAVWLELCALFEAFEEYNADFLSRGLRENWEDRWREHLALHDDRLILIARAADEAIGYLIAGVQRDYGLFDDLHAFISDTFIRPSHRSQGLGRRLLRRVEEWSRERGVNELRLEVYSANKPAVRFWTLAGFGLESMGMKKKLGGGG